jgi:hypothetical protein
MLRLVILTFVFVAAHSSLAWSNIGYNQQQILENQQQILRNQSQAEWDLYDIKRNQDDIKRSQRKIREQISNASAKSEENQRQILLRQNAMMTGSALPIATGKVLWIKDRKIAIDIKYGRFRVPGNKHNTLKTWRVGDIVDVYEYVGDDKNCNFRLDNVTRKSQATVVRKL